MTTLEAILLGMIQGLTEFLPVSSSGHLLLIQYFLGMQNLEHFLFFDLSCHLGTLLAIIVIFFQKIKTLFQKEHRQLWTIGIAILPLFPLLLIIKPIKAIYSQPSYLGFFFIATSVILFLGINYGKNLKDEQTKIHPLWNALVIGLWQALAILPGISRSGSTISGARLLGWNRESAVTFSFLLAIPTILGGTTLELIKLWDQPETTPFLPFSNYVLGFTLSFFIGLFSLQLVMRLAIQNRFNYFAWYCLILGLATTCYFHL